MNDKEILKRVKSLLLCLMAHPDNQPDSEFVDRINDLIDIRDELSERQTLDKSQDKGDSKALHIADVSSCLILQPEDVEQWLQDNENEHIRDKDGLTGQYNVSVKDIVDLAIDLS